MKCFGFLPSCQYHFFAVDGAAAFMLLLSSTLARYLEVSHRHIQISKYHVVSYVILSNLEFSVHENKGSQTNTQKRERG